MREMNNDADEHETGENVERANAQNKSGRCGRDLLSGRSLTIEHSEPRTRSTRKKRPSTIFFEMLNSFGPVCTYVGCFMVLRGRGAKCSIVNDRPEGAMMR